MNNIILKYTMSTMEYMESLKLSSATWSHRPIQLEDGEWGIDLYDILRADQLGNMGLENMTLDQLKALLPQIRNLYKNAEATPTNMMNMTKNSL